MCICFILLLNEKHKYPYANEYRHEFCIYVYIMSGLFLHKENQTILWNLLHKSPYFIEFQQKYPNQKADFFNQAIAAISREMYFHPTTVSQLTEINKEALTQMIAKLKQVLGYSAAWNQYNISEERTQKAAATVNNYNLYEEQYRELLKAPKAPDLNLNLAIKDEKIGGDMEELIKRQTELRERDIYIPPPPPTQNMGGYASENIPRELKAISSKSNPAGIPDILKPVSTKMVVSATPVVQQQPPRLKITEEEEPITVDKEFGVDGEIAAYSPTPDGFNIRQELETRGGAHSVVPEYHGTTQYQLYDQTNKIHMAIGAPPSTMDSTNRQVRWVDEIIPS